MDLQNGKPMCTDCSGMMYGMAVTNFDCKNCGKRVTGRHTGGWHYCDSCAQRLNRCTMCGKELSAK